MSTNTYAIPFSWYSRGTSFVSHPYLAAYLISITSCFLPPDLAGLSRHLIMRMTVSLSHLIDLLLQLSNKHPGVLAKV